MQGDDTQRYTVFGVFSENFARWNEEMGRSDEFKNFFHNS